MLSFDPTRLIRTPDQAVTAANTMMQMSAVGLGPGIDQVSDAGIWEANTEGPLAAMLYAASPRGNGAGIEWVLLAVDNMRIGRQLTIEPGWQMAAEIVRDRPLFHNALMRTLGMDPKQRHSIALTMRKAVMPWMRLALRGIEHPAFDEAFLAESGATLYVLSPAKGCIAGVAVALLEHLVKVWRAKTARREMRHRLLGVIDEAANVAPMPALRRHVIEGRGLGVNFRCGGGNVTMPGLGKASIIVEAGERSGTRVQARAAVEHCRAVILTDIVVNATQRGKQLADRPGVYVAESKSAVMNIVESIVAEDVQLDIAFPSSAVTIRLPDIK
jgi:hypothetical protein